MESGMESDDGELGTGISVNAAPMEISSTEMRFQSSRQRRWTHCWCGFSCFGSHRRGKRIVPASRVTDGNSLTSRVNGNQSVGTSSQATTVTPSLLAPPSSPASFTNSAFPSVAQSPNNFLSLSTNSPIRPSSTIFATGPYANETQLVSPPVFSTYTTEPSTAPFTPPPELSHFTTPSSPDVPFAQFLSSSIDLKSSSKESGAYSISGDLQATYPLYPESPASGLISPISGTSGDGSFPSLSDRDFSGRWNSLNGSSKIFFPNGFTSKDFPSQESGFFCSAMSAQFYLDQAQQSGPAYSQSGGKLSLSRETDLFSNNGNSQQNWHSKNCKPDAEEIEAYRASFGFSADEMITTSHYVEGSEVDESFTMSPFPSNEPFQEKCTIPGDTEVKQFDLIWPKGTKSLSIRTANGSDITKMREDSSNRCSVSDSIMPEENRMLHSNGGNHICDELNLRSIKVGKRSHIPVLSISDTEIDYRRVTSMKSGNGDLLRS